MAINDVKTLTLYTAVFLALGTLSAQGDANLNCQAYANAAVNHQQQNLKSKCGFKGGRWSLNYNGHQAWCKLGNVKMFNLTTEDKARTAALNNCKKKKKGKISGRKKELKCQVYASRAVKLTTQRNKACNKTSGKATNLDFRRYCMKVGPKLANKKMQNCKDRSMPAKTKSRQKVAAVSK